VKRADEIRTIVHRQVRAVIQRSMDMLVVSGIIFALDSIHGDLHEGDQRCCHIILCGKRVGCRQHHLGATKLQGAHQVGGFSGHMQACRNSDARQGALAFKPFVDGSQDGHFPGCPFNAPATAFRQLDIFYVIICHGFSF